MMQNFGKQNMNWLVFVVLGLLLIYIAFSTQPEEEYLLLLYFFGAAVAFLGFFSLIFPEKRLLWMTKERVDLFTRALVWFLVALIALASLGVMIDGR